MPFKIVQTVERGKTFLSCVPSAWENDNLLFWPRKGSKKLQKNEDSQPGDDWISTHCQVKRSDLTYDEAQLEISRMQRESDTEEETLPMRRQLNNANDMNDLAMWCIQNKENIVPATTCSELEVEQPEVSVPLSILHTPIEQPTFLTPETPIIMQQDIDTDTLLLIQNTPQKSFEEIVFKKFEKIENTQEKILIQLSQVSTQIDTFLRQTQQQKFNSQIGFKKIDSIDELQNFNDELKNKDSVCIFKEKLSLICGAGKGTGLNNCFALVDVLFTRRFLTECSWAGGCKNSEIKKHCFKSYNRVINLFFEVIQHSDKTLTLMECETFFKNVLRKSGRRFISKMLRTSTTKKRISIKKAETITKENSDAPVAPATDQATLSQMPLSKLGPQD